VLRGTLLVVPVGNGFLYVEPVYLQAERGRIPELKRVIVAAGDRIEMRETLEEAVAAVLAPDEGRQRPAVTQANAPSGPTEASPGTATAEGPPPEAGSVPAPGTEPPVGDSDASPPTPRAAPEPGTPRARALAHLEAARARLAAGDWQGYAAEMAALERALREE